MGDSSINAVKSVAGDNQRTFDEFQMLNEKAVDTANIMLRSAILINGGAAVAVLGFVAAFAGSECMINGPLMKQIAKALMSFAWGVGVATIAIVFAYFTHYATLAVINLKDANETRRNEMRAVKVLMQIIAIILAFTSVILFIHGAYSVENAIVSQWMCK